MIIRVLGCYGNEYPGFRTTCMLINRTIALDAGSITSSLKLSEQAKLKHILLTHSHLDHVLDIGFLADNIIGRIARPVEIVGVRSVLEPLMKYILSNRIWPDFTKIPTAESPVLKTKKIKMRTSYKIEDVSIKAIPVNHTVPTTGFLVTEAGSGSVIFSGDTGPTRELWNVANKTPDLRAVFLETSFPNRMRETADITRHLVPETMAEEITKIDNYRKIKFYIHHMKPLYLKEIAKEVKALGLKNVSVLEAGKRINIK